MSSGVKLKLELELDSGLADGARDLVEFRLK